MIIDRDEETNLILDEIKNEENDKTIIRMVYAKTAIGKSAFSNKVINKLDEQNILPICIRTFPENIGDQRVEWEYFELLFERIMNTSLEKNQMITFSNYIQNDPLLIQSNFSSVYNEINSFSIKKNIQKMIKGYMKKPSFVDEYNPYNITADDSLKSKMVKKNYLKYNLKKNRILLVIDNIQNIDRNSLKNILDVINETKNKNHYIIFEYTLSKENTKEKMYDLIHVIENYGLCCKELNLKRIPNEFIVDLVEQNIEYKPETYTFNKELLNYYDSLSEGNLFQVFSFVNNYNLISKEKYISPDETYKKIKNLKYDGSKLLLSLILQNSGKVLSQIAIKVFQKLKIPNYDEAVNELMENKFILVHSNSQLVIQHASINDSWENSHDNEFVNNDIIIRNVLEQLYLKALENNDTSINLKKLPWLALLEIYQKKYPQKIYDLISHLREGILKNVSPETAWYFLDKFILKTKNEIEKYIDCYYDILNLCFEFELYEEGMKCIEEMQKVFKLDSNKKLLLYKMLYYSALDKHIENIEYFKKYKFIFKEYTREYLNLLIIVQASYRGLNLRSECISIFNEIYGNKRIYMNYDEYGYFLRITNMYFPKKKSLRYLKKSIKFFEDRHLYHQSGKSAISYGHVLSSIGKLSKGKYYINFAEERLKDKQMGLHMIYVNKAAIMLHNKIYTNEVWDYLEIAEVSARVPFDKIAIQINKLVWHFGNDNFDNCEIIINKLKQLCPLEPDKNVVAMAYYNLYLYFKYINDTNMSNLYKKLAYELKDWSKSIENRFSNTYDKDCKYVLSKPWSICFLEYWTYDFLL